MKAEFTQQLITPREVKRLYPITAAGLKVVKDTQEQLAAVFEGKDPRPVLLIGPCSADCETSVLDYLARLSALRDEVSDKILIVPRVYTNKPRSTGEGYKGMLHQPDPRAESNLQEGILTTRRLHLRAITEFKFACADEMLYPENYSFLDDLLAYVAIGARSVENQQHRLVGSAIEAPLGLKNPTGGDLSVMLNGIYAAQHRHTFIYRGWEIKSAGNPHAHAILRGYTNKHGESQPNYHYEDLILLANLYAEFELLNPAVIIDANHANSNKNPFEQPRIIQDVLSSMHHTRDIAHLVKGFMVESYLEDGHQHIGNNIYGKSITDPCLGWDKTRELILRLAGQF